MKQKKAGTETEPTVKDEIRERSACPEEARSPAKTESCVKTTSWKTETPTRKPIRFVPTAKEFVPGRLFLGEGAQPYEPIPQPTGHEVPQPFYQVADGVNAGFWCPVDNVSAEHSHLPQLTDTNSSFFEIYEGTTFPPGNDRPSTRGSDSLCTTTSTAFSHEPSHGYQSSVYHEPSNVYQPSAYHEPSNAYQSSSSCGFTPSEEAVSPPKPSFLEPFSPKLEPAPSQAPPQADAPFLSPPKPAQSDSPACPSTKISSPTRTAATPSSLSSNPISTSDDTSRQQTQPAPGAASTSGQSAGQEESTPQEAAAEEMTEEERKAKLNAHRMYTTALLHAHDLGELK